MAEQGTLSAHDVEEPLLIDHLAASDIIKGKL
jgi:hypothetical protein